jgi:NAD(P)-dependent dehydrogenase (short-subunit alcohol dehydrogenase family)
MPARRLLVPKEIENCLKLSRKLGLARIAQGRWARPEDMAGTAVWLASSASDYVTGVAIPVDGGYSAAL